MDSCCTQGRPRLPPLEAVKIVLGLLVDGDSVRLSKNMRNQIETHIRGANIFGLKAHAAYRNFSSVFGFVHHVEGLLAFAHDVDPEYADARYRSWHEIMRQPRISRRPISMATELDTTHERATVNWRLTSAERWPGRFEL